MFTQEVGRARRADSFEVVSASASRQLKGEQVMSTPKGREVLEVIVPLISSVRIKNFRGFKDISLQSLDRVNLITGKNNVGKTAFLDAIFVQLGPNNPELLLRTNAFRGIDRVDADPEEIWGVFFYDRDFDQPIEMTIQSTSLDKNTLRITLTSSDRSQFSRKNLNNRPNHFSTTQIKRDELVFEYKGTGGSQKSTAILEADGEIRYQRAGMKNLKPGIFFGTRTRFPQDDAARFSRLERAGQDREVVEIMKIIEPRLKRLSVLYTGGAPLIHADIGTRQLVPIPVMGEGMARILAIVLGMIMYEGGVALIDEIENGLHYSVLEPIWTAIAETSRKYQVQVFATTHSWECTRAAHQAFEKSNIYDFRLHRLERDGDNVRSLTYDNENIRTSLEMNWEVR
jgi:AAA15 family ATPase/GTPase